MTEDDDEYNEKKMPTYSGNHDLLMTEDAEHPYKMPTYSGHNDLVITKNDKFSKCLPVPGIMTRW
jgi:hypothetical protein